MGKAEHETLASEIDNRKTDPQKANFHVEVVFLVGRTVNDERQARILDESQSHNDLIQENFLDSYNNLTLKTLLMLKWVNVNCAGKSILLSANFSYLIKILKVSTISCDLNQWNF